MTNSKQPLSSSAFHLSRSLGLLAAAALVGVLAGQPSRAVAESSPEAGDFVAGASRTFLPMSLADAQTSASVPGSAEPLTPATAPSRGENGDHRYMLGLLDDRSTYGTFWFPEPLSGPEMDVDRELRVDFFHGEGHGHRQDQVVGEFEYAIGLLTLEVEVPYERQVENGDTTDGLGSIELAARHPIFQYVAADGSWDYTLVAGLEVAIPTGSDVSKDTEIVPKLGQLIRIGKHVSVQATVGYSFLIGPEEGGTNTIEYSAALGYDIDRQTLPLPGIEHLIPLFEINGDNVAEGPDSGQNALFGTVGVRFNFKSIDGLPAQPRLGVGYVFPLDQGAREELRWGIITSLIFEY